MTTNADTTRALRHARGWAVAGGVFGAVALAAGAFLYGHASASETTAADRGYVIAEQDNLIDSGCKLAGGKVEQDPDLREACTRIAQGKPAVPVDAARPRDGAPGVGIRSARQVDRCYVEVVLTDGTSGRYGSFCGKNGRPGKTGPSGPSGVPGVDGQPGQDGPSGVGVADVRADGCNVVITLTDGSTRVVGPFCGPPVPEYTLNQPDGSAMHCVRDDGGSDTAPVYTCEQTRPPTTTAAPPTATETSTETATETVTESAEPPLPTAPGGLFPTR